MLQMPSAALKWLDNQNWLDVAGQQYQAIDQALRLHAQKTPLGGLNNQLNIILSTTEIAYVDWPPASHTRRLLQRKDVSI